MMYKKGLRVLVFYGLGKTVQGEEIVICKEQLWRRLRLFLEVLNKRVSGNSHKLQ